MDVVILEMFPTGFPVPIRGSVFGVDQEVNLFRRIYKQKVGMRTCFCKKKVHNAIIDLCNIF